MAYIARIYDKSKSLLAILENTVGAHYTRRIGQACEVGFGIPASDPKAALLSEAMYFDLYRDGTRIASARIEKRDMDRTPYVVTGLTNEIKLRDLMTPANWTYDGWEAMDAIRDLLLEFRTFVKQTKADWEDVAGARYRVDTTTQPTRAGDVVLAKDSTGHYYSSGYVITAPIDLGPDVFKIDRIRWQQTVGEAVSIKVQTRTGNTPTPDASWSAWSAEQGVAVPEESARTGVPCTSPTGRYIQVKLNLYTTDTQTPSETGTTFGFTPILHACEVVARYRTELVVGSVPASINRQLQGVGFSYTNHLEAIGQICDKIKYDWEIDGDNRLNVAPRLGTDKSAQIVLREGENTNITVLRDEPGEVVNVLTALGAGDGLAQLRLTLQDDASIAKYGRRPGVYENRDLTDRDALLAEAQEYLSKAAWPQPELQVETIVDPEWPEFRVGDTVRVISPRNGINTTARILEERRQSTERGEVVTLGLNTTLQDLIDVILGERSGLAGAPIVAPPTNVAARGGHRFIELSWTGDADYFVIEHSEDGISFAVLEPRWTAHRYRHNDLALGSYHSYRLYAVKGNARSRTVGPFGTTARDLTAPPAPTNLQAVVGPGKVVRLSWTPPQAEDLAEYQVWRKEGNTPADPTGATRVADEAGTVHVDTTGEYGASYTYFVKAVDTSENVSDFSTGVAVTLPPPEAGVDLTPPASLAGCTLTFASDSLYQDAQGNWFVRVSMTLSGIPADDKRAYLQVKHRRQGSATYALDDQVYAASGDVVIAVDDLLPNAAYDFAVVPVSHFGIEGEGKTASRTTAKDTQAPAVPTFKAVGGIVKGIFAELNTPAEADWDGFEIHVSEAGSTFTPDPSTLKAKGRQTRFEITGLVPGRTYYVKAIAYDTSGNKSAPAY